MSEYEEVPRRRRTDDLTLNEWRLFELEKRSEDLKNSISKMCTDVSVLANEIKLLRGELSRVNKAVWLMPFWFVGTVITITSIAATLFLHR